MAEVRPCLACGPGRDDGVAPGTTDYLTPRIERDARPAAVDAAGVPVSAPVAAAALPPWDDRRLLCRPSHWPHPASVFLPGRLDSFRVIAAPPGKGSARIEKEDNNLLAPRQSDRPARQAVLNNSRPQNHAGQPCKMRTRP